MAHFTVELDRESDVPLGTQLAWQLRGAVASGALGPGERLPGVRELAEAAGVNVNTVRAVYARLGEQGVIVSEHGRGTFVATGIADQSSLRELAERAASEARRAGVDPRELAALLFAGGGAAAPERAGSAPARQALRTEIERLESDLAELESELAERGARPGPEKRGARRPGRGPRLLDLPELESIRDRLAAQVADRRARLTVAADAEAAASIAATREAASPWPELLFSRRSAPGGT